MLKDIFLMAMEGLRDRKFRVALNIVGILIGIAALTALVSITQGMSIEINKQLESLGSTTISVTPGGGFGMRGSMGGGTGRGTLTVRDVDRIRKLSNVALATPVVSGSVEIHIGGHSGVGTVLGVNPDEYIRIMRNIEVEDGRFLRRSDAASAVLGALIAHPPQFDEPLAQIGSRATIEIKLGGEMKTLSLRVVGILEEVGGFVSTDNQIFITFRTAQQFFETGSEVDSILIEAERTEVVEDVVEKVQDELGEGVTVISSSFIMERVGSITGTIEVVLGGIASISLIVAGIAIINTMTISVMERTREIGVMKAIGAKNREILTMFLMESSLTGLIGGAIGVALGTILSQLVSVIAAFTMAIPLTPAPSLEVGLAGMAFAVVTGTLAGLYPARKASKLSPVEALRYE